MQKCFCIIISFPGRVGGWGATVSRAQNVSFATWRVREEQLVTGQDNANGLMHSEQPSLTVHSEWPRQEILRYVGSSTAKKGHTRWPNAPLVLQCYVFSVPLPRLQSPLFENQNNGVETFRQYRISKSTM